MLGSYLTGSFVFAVESCCLHFCLEPHLLGHAGQVVHRMLDRRDDNATSVAPVTGDQWRRPASTTVDDQVIV